MSVAPYHDLILFRADNVNSVFPAHKLRSLYFYDKKANINRRYISIEVREAFGSANELFEVVLQGEVAVLRKQRSNVRYPSDANDFTYYCWYNNQLTTLGKFARRIYPELLSTHKQTLMDFVKANRLDIRTAANVIRIVEYYNQLLAIEGTLAKH